jgi:hypothetical protein
MVASAISIPLAWIVFRGYTQPEEEEATNGAGKRLLLAARNPMVLTGGVLAMLVSSQSLSRSTTGSNVCRLAVIGIGQYIFQLASLLLHRC